MRPDPQGHGIGAGKRGAKTETRPHSERIRRSTRAARGQTAEAAPEWLFVASGGALGALARGGLDAIAIALPLTGPLPPLPALAWSTVLVDLTGALLLGMISALLARRAAPGPGLVRLKLFAATGFAGAFTTYGTLIGATAEAMTGRPGALQILLAAASSLLLLVLGVLSAASGWCLARRLRPAVGKKTEKEGARPSDSAGRSCAEAEGDSQC